MLCLSTRCSESATVDVCSLLTESVGPLRSLLKRISLHFTPFLLELTFESSLGQLTIGHCQLWPGIRSISVVGVSPVCSSVLGRSGDSCAVNFRVWACHLPSGGDAARLWPRRSSLTGVGGTR